MIDPQDEMLERIKALEVKTDLLISYMEKSLGAWLFIKILGSMAVGGILIWNFILNLVHQLKDSL